MGESQLGWWSGKRTYVTTNRLNQTNVRLDTIIARLDRLIELLEPPRG